MTGRRVAPPTVLALIAERAARRIAETRWAGVITLGGKHAAPPTLANREAIVRAASDLLTPPAKPRYARGRS